MRSSGTPSSVLLYFMTALQLGADVRRRIEKHEGYVSSDVQKDSTTEKRKERTRELLSKSKTHVSSLLRDISFFFVVRKHPDYPPLALN